MSDRHVLERGQASVRWPQPISARSTESLRVRLFARGAAPAVAPFAEWDFGRPDGAPESLDIDLWHLDFHSVQLQTTAGVRLARSFVCNPDERPSSPIYLHATWEVGAASRPALAADLVMPPEDLHDARERLARYRSPSIQWFFVELTNRCNFRCAWCPRPQMRRPVGAMPYSRVRELFDRIADYRRRHPLFSLYAELRNPVFLHVMGEPLLHPNFAEIVTYANERDIDCCLVTNASLLRRKVVEEVFNSGIKSVLLSLNAPDAAAFSATGAKIGYDTLVRQIQDFVAERYRRRLALPRIELQLLNSTTAEIPGCRLVEDGSQVQEQLALWSRFARDLERQFGSTADGSADDNVAERWSTVLGRKLVSDPDTYFTLGPNFSLVFKQTCNFANALLPVGAHVRETPRGRCPFGNAHRVLCVFWDGSCSFCSLDYENEVALGNVFEQGIDEIWEGARMHRIRALMDQGILAEPLCRRCLGTVIDRPASHAYTQEGAT
jgi:MoaA/NifB/PqqE/SkfB family radical SAM enzyme